MKFAKQYTFTDYSTMKSLIDAIRYIINNKIEGCLVECGVWKGGSVIVMIKTMQFLEVSDREIYLFDTFEGMSRPTEQDIHIDGSNALENHDEREKNDLTKVSLDEVKANVFKTGYDKSKIHFIKGKVENILSKNLHDKIALLRLDTDWYESTKCELEYLFPKLSVGGVLVVDDYGVWGGSRKATDEYIGKNKINILLQRLHPSGARMGVKQKKQQQY